MLGISCIVELACSFVGEDSPDTFDPFCPEVKSIFTNLLSYTMEAQTAKRALIKLMGNGDSIDKVVEIMSTCDTPIPNDFGNDINDLFSSQIKRKPSHNWVPNEDRRLLAGILKFGSSNWAQIAKFVGAGRTRSQCSQRWSRSIAPHISKTKWTAEDDQKLLNLVAKFGVRSWAKIAKNIGSRSDVQCRYRYNLLTKNSCKEQQKKMKKFINFRDTFPPQFPFQQQYQPPFQANSTFLPQQPMILEPQMIQYQVYQPQQLQPQMLQSQQQKPIMMYENPIDEEISPFFVKQGNDEADLNSFQVKIMSSPAIINSEIDLKFEIFGDNHITSETNNADNEFNISDVKIDEPKLFHQMAFEDFCNSGGLGNNDIDFNNECSVTYL